MKSSSSYQQQLSEQVQSQFEQLAPLQNLVILNPSYHRFFPMCLSYFLAQGRLGHWNAHLLGPRPQAWAGQLARDFDLLGPIPQHPQDLAQQMAPVGEVVILLEANQGPVSSELEAWLGDFCLALGPGQRVIYWGHHLPTSLIARFPLERCAILPHLPEDLLVDHRRGQAEKQVLEVRTLGPLAVFIRGREIEDWEGFLPRSFFHFIIDRGMTTRNDIFSTFWPNLDKKESTNIFHVTKRKVNELLDHDLTLYTGGFYRLSDTIQLHYDVVMFQEAMQMADISTQAAQAIPLYEKALSLYRGPFLNTIEMDWVKSRREELQQIYVDGMLNLADIYAQQGRTAQSLGLQQRAFALMPHREDIAHKLLTSALQNGQKGLGQEVFASLSTQLKRLGLSPSASILALMQQISAA